MTFVKRVIRKLKKIKKNTIPEPQTSLEEGKLSPFMQGQIEFSKSPEWRMIVDEVIEGMTQENLRDKAIIEKFHSVTLSKEPQSRRLSKATLTAYRNSPESEQIWQECLEMLEREQEEEAAIGKGAARE